MKYEVISELGIKRFYKVERLRDWLWRFFPQWLYKLRVERIPKNGIREVGQFVNNKRVVIFNFNSRFHTKAK